MKRYKIKDIVQEVSERENSPSSSTYRRFVGLEHYESGNVVVTQSGSVDRLESAMKVFHAGDILIARRNVYLRRAGVVCFDGLTSGDSIVLRPMKSELKNILPFVFNSDSFWEFANRYADGTMSKRLSPKILRDFEIELPEGEALKRLTELLWAAYDLKESYKRLLAASDELAKFRFVEMFGDPIRNPKGWSMDELDAHIDVLTGYPFDSSKYVADGIKICGGLIIMPGRIEWDACKNWGSVDGLEEYLLQAGDIVLALDRPWISDGFKIACVGEDELPCLLIQRTARIRGRDMNQRFLYAMLNSDAFQAHCTITGSLVPHISHKDIKNFRTILPPLALQNEFAEFVEQLDKSKLTLKNAIKKQDEMIHILLSTKLGVMP